MALITSTPALHSLKTAFDANFSEGRRQTMEAYAAAGLAGLAELAELANFKRQLGIAFCQTSIWKKKNSWRDRI